MAILGTLLMVVGGIIGLIYGIILLVKAFQTHILWGLGYLFVPFVGLIFVIVHWEVAKKPFLRMLIAIPFYIVGAILVAMGAPEATGY
jgi:uncharacterized membrane protein